MATTKKKKKAKPKAKRPKATRKAGSRKRERDPTAGARTRPEQMQRLRDKGWTYERIAKHYDLTRQRVWQILSKNQPSGKSGKRKKSTLLNGRTAERKLEQMKRPKTVGDRIVARRIRMKMTIGDLSSESGIPYGVLSNYENNDSKPSFDSIVKLCTAFNCSAHWLIFGHSFKKSRS